MIKNLTVAACCLVDDLIKQRKCLDEIFDLVQCKFSDVYIQEIEQYIERDYDGQPIQPNDYGYISPNWW